MSGKFVDSYALFANDLNKILDAFGRLGVKSGCIVSQSSPPAMTVQVAAGYIFQGHEVKSVSAVTVTVAAPGAEAGADAGAGAAHPIRIKLITATTNNTKVLFTIFI